jgi:hypothetical protein
MPASTLPCLWQHGTAQSGKAARFGGMAPGPKRERVVGKSAVGQYPSRMGWLQLEMAAVAVHTCNVSSVLLPNLGLSLSEEL